MEEQERKLKERIIREQDLVCFLAVNPEIFKDYCKEPKLSHFNIKEYIFNNPDLFEKFSTKNLLNILSVSSNKDGITDLVKIIMERLKTEDFYIEEYNKEVIFSLKTYYTAEYALSKLGDENQEIIKSKMLERIEKAKDILRKKGISEEVLELDKLQNTATTGNLLKYIEDGTIDNKKMEFITSRLKENKDFLQHVNFLIFQDEIFQLGEEFIDSIIVFPTLCAKISIIKENNPQLFQILKTEINRSKPLEDNLSKIEILINYFTNHVFKIQIPEIDDETMKKLLDCAIYDSRNIHDVEIDYDENYYENFNEKCDSKYEEQKSLFGKSIYLTKYFSISEMEARNIVEQYGKDLEELSRINPEIDIQYIKSLKEILEIEDSQILDRLYYNTTKQYRPSEVLDLLNMIEKTASRTYSEQLNTTNQKLQNEDENIQYIDYNGKKIKQINLNGNFNLILHSTDTGFLRDKKLEENVDFKQLWNNSKNKMSHILSMVYINQNFMGCPPVGDNGVMYGFTGIDSQKIKLMGNTDINTYSNNFSYGASTPTYITGKNMLKTARRVYAEFGLEKKGTNPDYVVQFDDSSETVIENTKKAASQFGIPILYIDKSEIEKQQITNIDGLLNEFQEAQDIEIMKKILNTYETNVAGWLLNRSKNGEDKSFTNSINNERFREDFKQCFSRISETLNNYLSQITEASLIEREEGIKDITRMMLIVLEERDLYERAEETKPISKTSIMIDAEGIIKKINETFTRIGRDDLAIDLKEIPTAEQYKIKLEELMKNALQGENPITIEDVNQADLAKQSLIQKSKDILQEVE